jgi:Tfp pilus assembly protein FimT
MLVIILIGIVLVLAVPSTRNVLVGDHLKKASRQIIGLERQLRTDAVRKQLDHILCLDLSNATYWVITSDMTPQKQDEIKKNPGHLPPDVQIMDVVQENNIKTSVGEVRIKFGRNNICAPAVIHLSHEEEKMTIVINPFLGITDIYNQYVDIPVNGQGKSFAR